MRRRRERYRPFKDWRDPDMLVQRTYIDQFTGRKVVKEMYEEESRQLSREALTIDYPTYRHDPSYGWADEVRRKKEGKT